MHACMWKWRYRDVGLEKRMRNEAGGRVPKPNQSFVCQWRQSHSSGEEDRRPGNPCNSMTRRKKELLPIFRREILDPSMLCLLGDPTTEDRLLRHSKGKEKMGD